MEKVQQPTSKKARVESPIVGVKQELPEGEQPSGGAGAMVAMEVPAPIVEEHVVSVDKDKLHCPRCTLPLKPPIFQFHCEAGHVACSTCHGLLPKNKCYSCHQDGAYGRSVVLEGIVRSARIKCPYHAYGCRSYAAGEHQRECPWAPCSCAEPGCGFLGSPPMLRDHLRDAHAWPVDKVRYGRAHNLLLPESQPRRLLDAEDDGRVFLVSAGAHGERHGAAVSCVRASTAAAAAGPRYY